MRIDAKIFGEDGNRISIPISVYRMKEWILPMLGNLMYVFGIRHAELDVRSSNLFPVVNISYEESDDTTVELPSILDDMRPQILRSIKDLMILFGLSHISLEFEKDELINLYNYWAYINDGSGTYEDDPELGVPMPKLREKVKPLTDNTYSVSNGSINELGTLVEDTCIK